MFRRMAAAVGDMVTRKSALVETETSRERASKEEYRGRGFYAFRAPSEMLFTPYFWQALAA